jgi:hypothetical protein
MINRSLEINRKDFRIMQSRPVSKPTRDDLGSGKLILFAHIYLRNSDCLWERCRVGKHQSIWRGSAEDVAMMPERGGPTNLDKFRGRDKWNSAGYAAAASG